MKLIVNDQIFELNNNTSVLAEMESKINTYIHNQKLHFSHYVVDGIEVFENQAEFFNKNIERIETVEAVVLTMEQFIQNVIDTVQQYLKQALPAIDEFTEHLYDGSEEIGSNKTVQLTQALDWIIQSVITIDSIPQKPTDWDTIVQYATDLKPILQEIVEVLEKRDPVLFADILQYEVSPVLEVIEEKLQDMMNHENV
ncbi:hypothetical protein [Alkalibacillus salilacus]|uniref:DUF8042 domain-containing protein n=1 Tax=Alkalibacillus salilacus TaxID=284582 RepID=A0ABT9VFA8_9BACI|nr:hypothetical protein [Alkalibacillus salilacus]MDQ0159651.1 hypothetical protein [Alkalibacillus salilacus]